MRQIQKDILTKLGAIRPAPQALIDIGCGSGYFTRIIASRLPRTQISGVDPKAPSENDGTNRITYLRSEVESLPFPSNSFDAAIACVSFHHWNDKKAGMLEVFRVLKPNGIFLLGDPFYEGVMRNKFMAWLLEKTDGGTFTSFQDFDSCTENAGFKAIETSLVSSSFGTMFVIVLQKPEP